MKKISLTVVSIVAIVAAGLGGYSYYQQSQIDPNILVNMEAISETEKPQADKNCGLIWGTGCYADNYGARCYFQEDCSK